MGVAPRSSGGIAAGTSCSPIGGLAPPRAEFGVCLGALGRRRGRWCGRSLVAGERNVAIAMARRPPPLRSKRSRRPSTRPNVRRFRARAPPSLYDSFKLGAVTMPRPASWVRLSESSSGCGRPRHGLWLLSNTESHVAGAELVAAVPRRAATSRPRQRQGGVGGLACFDSRRALCSRRPPGNARHSATLPDGRDRRGLRR
jgi:hypothetical protein